MVIDAFKLPREAVVKEASVSQEEQASFDLGEDGGKNEKEEVLQGNEANDALDYKPKLLREDDEDGGALLQA